MHIKISNGNTKMGSIPSVSLPSGITCRDDCGCRKKCYAAKIERLRKAVKDSYLHNFNILNNEPDVYWREVEAVITLSRFFRFHVSGDIPNLEYLEKMVGIANRNQHCHILCFTKRHEFVNAYLSANTFPENLHIVLSGWRGFEFENPHNLPEAHVLYRDGYTTARQDAVMCDGNCAECATTDKGCWTLKHGEQVIFKEH